MSKKKIWRARLVPRFGQITVHEVMRMFATTLINIAEALHWTPIKILSKLGEEMQEQVDEIDRRTKAIDKRSPKAAESAKRSGMGR